MLYMLMYRLRKQKDYEIAENMVIYLSKAVRYFEIADWLRHAYFRSHKSGLNHIDDDKLMAIRSGLYDLLCSVDQVRREGEVGVKDGGLTDQQLEAIADVTIRLTDRRHVLFRRMRAYFVLSRMERLMERLRKDAELLRDRMLPHVSTTVPIPDDNKNGVVHFKLDPRDTWFAPCKKLDNEKNHKIWIMYDSEGKLKKNGHYFPWDYMHRRRASNIRKPLYISNRIRELKRISSEHMSLWNETAEKYVSKLTA